MQFDQLLNVFSLSNSYPSAFKSLKKRFLEGQTKISELNAKLKQRDRKGSHEQVYQERDALLSHLHKSYLAFEEKYGENEKLKKMIQELQAQVCIYPTGPGILKGR